MISKIITELKPGNWYVHKIMSKNEVSRVVVKKITELLVEASLKINKKCFSFFTIL